MKRYIHSESRQEVHIPAEFEKYYDVISDRDLENLTGMEGSPYPCEETKGYDCRHVAWLAAKEEYADALMDNGLEFVELMDENGYVFVGQCVGDRIYPVDIQEVERCCDDII